MSGPHASTPPPRHLARYVIETHLGETRGDSAYLAYDPRLRRKVVLRLSRELGASSSALREARLLARLSHPNVARVHDVGVAAFEHPRGPDQGTERVNDLATDAASDPSGDPVNYVAVEYIDGRLWSDWVSDASATDVLAAALELCSAVTVLHGADLPHGALEPEDVRVDARGRVVLDGLATGRAERAAAGERPRADQAAVAEIILDGLGEDGQRGGRLGARTRRSVTDVLARGRAGDFPSVAAMGQALQEAASPRSPWPWVWLGGAAAVSAGLAVVLSSRDSTRDCHDEVDARVEAVWSVQRRASVRTAVLEADVRENETLAAHLDPILDRYASRWSELLHGSCEAHDRAAAEAGAGLAAQDAQRRCLEAAGAELDAFLSVLEDEGGPERTRAVERALKSASRLPDLDTCIRAGESREAPGGSEAIGEQLAWIRALKRAGRDAAADEAATQMLRNQDVDENTRSKLRLVRGVVRLRARDLAGAEQEALAAYHLSVTGGDIGQQVRAASFLVSLYGKYRADFGQAETWLQVAKSHAAQPGADPLLEAVVCQHEGNYLYGRGRYDEALAALDRGIEVRTELQGAEHDMVYALRNNHAAALRALGRAEEAEAEQRRTVAYLERTYGTMNPEVARSYNNIGAALNGQGRHADAVELLDRAVEIWKATKGPSYPDLGMAYSNLGNAHALLGQEAEAEAALVLAVEVWTEAFGPDNYRVGIARNNLAGALVTAQHFERGLAEAEAAYEIQAAALGTEHPDLTYAIANAAFSACRLGRLVESRRWADRGLALVIEQDGKLPTEAAEMWLVASELRLFEAREPGASADLKSLAIADLTRAREIADSVPEPLIRRANAAVLLADALYEFDRPGMAAATAEAIRRIDAGPLEDEVFVKARARLAARVEPEG